MLIVYLTLIYATSSYQYADPISWNAHATSSSFQTMPFAHSVLQRTAPSTAYPTPPPPGISTSSSSLAFALGMPEPPKQLAPSATVYKPQESQAFYEAFLEDRASQIDRKPQTPAPQKPAYIGLDESPDPLALRSDNSTRPAVTPKKRKPIVLIESPSIKRIQTLKATASGQRMPQSSVPLTPSSKASPFSTKSPTPQSVTPTHKRIVNMAYVAVPPSPWLTPSSSRKPSVLTDSMKSKVKFTETPDLGGYGSEDDGPSSPTKRFTLNDSVKSSARRTGDRDERGDFDCILLST